MSYEQKTAFITGASRGIGNSIARHLANEGYDLYLLSRKDVNDLSSLPGKHYAGDVGDYKFIETIISEMPRVDVVINNAGISKIGLLQDLNPEDWDEIIRTNLTSLYNVCHAAIPKMLKNHSGRIINISSVWGVVGSSTEVAYSASKGGINAFTRALAKELAPSNIQVNAIACGVIDTDMNKCFSEEERNALIDEIPACRMGTPGDVAELVSLLVNTSNYLTGQIINLDGGWI
ncbi:MAG: SDR family NAD(P)-dependent oxidoreductase [Lachnospiraceae bacterium]|nr:SDR family NAD(P)-dependent oxidoreductase [Lachnospiraceae bacterium]MDN4743806.1 SDR family NAD(P)-dependent oxidoreductase [Lachnospiraceae bacterium C1.1]